jgi:hypothetical protein
LKKLIDENFISKTRARFNDMFVQLRDSLQWLFLVRLAFIC